MKEHDFLVAGLNNPDTTVGDMRALGMNMTNTQMLSKEEYLKSDYIKNHEAFKDDNGRFSQTKFDKIYENQLQHFKQFSEIQDGFQYDMYDFRRFDSPNSLVKNPNINVFKVSNPFETTIGSGWINEEYESPLSDTERAQQSKIYDHASGTYLDYSPNDHALFSNPIAWFKDIFNEPLVLATYEEGETSIDKDTGRLIVHSKGEKKVNDEGKFYYETLNGRSIYGKSVLSGWDTLTVDGKGFNSLDFMDSDDKDKSIGGTIVKTAAYIAPLFLSGPVGTLYTTTIIAKELMKALPMLDGVLGAINNSDTFFTPYANTLAAKGMAMSQSVSEYSQKNLISFENVANLLGDVALQWSQQQLIAKNIQELGSYSNITKSAKTAAYNQYLTAADDYTKAANAQIQAFTKAGRLDKANKIRSDLNKIVGDPKRWELSSLGQSYLNNAMIGITPKLEELGKLGRSASLMYMALISNTDVYQSMLAHGTTKREAIVVALGSMLGMYKVDTSGLGEVFFNNLTSDATRSIRATLRKNADEWITALTKNVSSPAVKANRLQTLFRQGQTLGKKLYSEFWEDIKSHSGGFFTKALGEGLEEAGEELAADASKQIYELMADIQPVSEFFGGLTTDNVNAFSNVFENGEAGVKDLLTRYGMNFAGGFLGGGLFYGVEKFKSNNWKRDTSQDKLLYLLRNNKKSTVLHVLEEYKNSGKLGSTTLSSQFELDANGKPVFLSVNESNISQNDFIYNQIKMEIETIDKIISDNGLAMSDGQLLNQITLGDIRFNNLKDILKGAEYQTGYIQRYDKLVQDYVNLEQQIQSEKQRPIADSNREAQAEQEEVIKNLEKRKEEKIKEINDFQSGENAVDYMGKLLFQMNQEVSKPFYTSTFDGWLKYKKSISLNKFDLLPPDEQEKLREEYFQYKNSSQLIDAEEAWINFKDFQDKIKSDLNGIQDKVKEYESYLEKINQLLDPENNPFAKRKNYNPEDFTEDNEDADLLLSYDELLELESQEEYDSRNSLNDEDRAKRYKKLQDQKAKEKNTESMINALREVEDIIINSGGILDPQSRRHLMLNIGVSRNDIVNQYKSNIWTDHNITTKILNTIQQELDKLHSVDDILFNTENIKHLSKAALLEDLEEEAKSRLKTILKVKETLQNKTLGLLDTDPDKVTLQSKVSFSQILDDINNYKNKLLRLINDSSFNINEFKADDSNIQFGNLLNLGFSGDEAISIISNIDLLEEYISTNDSTNLLDKYIQSSYDSTILDIYNKYNQNIIQENQINKWLQEFDEIYEVAEDYDVEGYAYNTLVANVIKLENSAIYNQYISDLENSVDLSINKLIDDIRSDEVYSLLTTIENSYPVNNPIVGIVKKLGLALNRDVNNIEELLNTLEQKLVNGSFNDFTLSPQQRNALDEAEQLLELAGAYLVSTYNSKDLSNPYPHNQLMNELIEKHKLDLELLPVIDDTVAPLFSQQISNLRHEIGITDAENGYTFGSWRYWDLKNALNKANQFLNSDKRLEEVKLNFFGKYRNLFKNVDINGTQYDLLEGYEDVLHNETDSFKRLVALEDLFYKNIHNIINNTGKQFYEILRLSQLSKLLTSNNDVLIEQSTAELNESLTVDKLTPMDLGLYLTTLSGLSATEYYKSLSNNSVYEKENIAPLSIQQHVSRAAMAYINNPDLYNQGLQWMYDLTDYSRILGGNKTYLLNALFIPGNGGAGKTEVVFPTIVDYAKKVKNLNDSDVWVSAPTKRQYDKLVELSKAKGFDVKELCEKLIGNTQYAQLLSEAEGTGVSSNLINVKTVTGKTIKVASDSLTYTTTEIPKLIVIDEATHCSTLQLSIISNFCKKHNIALILLGDNYQQGHKISEGIEDNVNQEVVFTGKTSRLSVTLRDSNYQKQTNVQQLVAYLDQLDKVPVGTSRELLLQELFRQYERVTIAYYDSTDINGDILVDKIDKSLINKCRTQIKGKSVKVGYLGNSADPEYQELCNKFNQDNVILFTNEVELQGQEVDYMFIKTNWKSFDDANLENKHQKLSDFLKRFYTLSTRGKTAAIFVNDGVLDKLIKFEKQNHQNTQTNFDEKAITKFKEYFRNKLSKLALSSSENTSNNETETESSETTAPSGMGHASIYDDEDDDFVSVSTSSQAEQELSYLLSDEKESELLVNDITLNDEALVYGEAHLLGVHRDSKGNWVFPKDSDLLRDIAIFQDEDTIVSDGSEKNALVEKLLRLKSIILYESEIVGINRNDLLKDIDDVIDEDVLDTIQYKLVVSKHDYNKHSFVGESKLTSDKITIDSGNVFQVCAEFKNKQGKRCLLTLGLLASPDTFKENIENDSISNIIQKRINSIQISSKIDSTENAKKIAELEKFKNNLSDIQESYRKNLQNYSNQLTNLGKSELIFDIENLTFNRSTVIRMIENSKQKNSLGKYIIMDVPRMRLTSLDESTNQIDDTIRQTNFERHNPYTVISPIYVYRQDANATDALNSIRGKAVVFVTKDYTFKGHPELLIDRWIEERQRNSPVHTVRMLRLDNAGVTLTDLCNAAYTDIFTTAAANGGDVNLLPFDNDVMGERMLIALHNFRANIQQFNKFLDTHPINIYNNDDVDRVLNEMYIKHQEGADTEEILNSLPDNDKKIAEQIINFNEACDAHGLRQFRLGGNKINGNPWLIRKTNVTIGKSNYYTKEDARLANRKKKGDEFEDSINAIYLTISAAKMFENVITEVCQAILDPFDIRIVRNTKTASGDVRESVVMEDEFIPITSQIYTSLRSKVNGVIPYEIKHQEDISRAVKYIPRSIIKLATRAIAYSKTQLDPDTNIRYLPEYKDLSRRDWNWQSVSTLHYSITNITDPEGKKIKKELEFRNLIENYGEDLVKILDLCFHGTSNTKGLVDAKLYGKQQKKGDEEYWSKVEPQSTDAIFKNGFYIDPMATVNGFKDRNNKTLQGYGLFAEVQTNRSLFTIQAAIDMPRFKIKFKPTTSTQVSTSETEIQSTPETQELSTNVWDNDHDIIISDFKLGKQKEIEDNIKNYFNMFGLSTNINLNDTSSFNDYIMFVNDEQVKLFIDPKNPNIIAFNLSDLNDNEQIEQIKKNYFQYQLKHISQNELNKIHDHFIDNGYYEIFDIENYIDSEFNILKALQAMTDLDSIENFVGLLDEVFGDNQSSIIQSLINTINDKLGKCEI